VPQSILSSGRALAWLLAGVLGVTLGCGGCDKRTLEERARVDAGDNPGGLTTEQAAKVLAKVGDKTITLGDFAASLDRMNEFDRMRYQSPEKRRELLNEMIDLELLAIEAKKRGLDRTPESEEAMRQILRDAMLAETRKGVPTPAEIPPAEVRAYYDAHRDDFREPERRRVTAIPFKDKKEAEKVLPEAKKASAMEWGRLALKHADPPLKQLPGQPVETVADLGIVGPPADAKGDHPRVPPELRAAIFEVQGDVGSVLDHVVASGGKHWIVRLAGKSPPHERSFAEAERSIRGILVQEKMEARAKELAESLKKRFPVSIDDAALAQVKVPGAPASASASTVTGAHAPPPSSGR